MRTRRFSIHSAAVAAAALAMLGAATVGSAVSLRYPQDLGRVMYVERLGARIDPSLPFIDDVEEHVRLGDFYGKRPILMTLVYYRCNVLCPELFNRTIAALQEVPPDSGAGYEWIVASIDPAEGPADAQEKKNAYVMRYRHRLGQWYWHFLTGPSSSIDSLTAETGNVYVEDVKAHQFAHPMGNLILTPGGRISRYFLGTQLSSAELRAALADAAAGKIMGPDTEHKQLVCFRYEPRATANGPAVIRAVRIVSAIGALGLGLMIALLFRREGRATAREV